VIQKLVRRLLPLRDTYCEMCDCSGQVKGGKHNYGVIELVGDFLDKDSSTFNLRAGICSL